MTYPTKQITSLISQILPEDIRKDEALKISVKERHLPSAQKQMIFEETVMKDYKKAMTKKRLKWVLSSAVVVAVFLSVGTCVFKNYVSPAANGYDLMMNAEMTSETSIITSSCTLTSDAPSATITFTDTHIIMNGRDSVRIDDSPFNSILVPSGKRAVVRLTDKTRIALSEKSRLGIPSSFTSNNRMLYFSGKGSFNVNHDKDHPFLVDASVVKTHVLGTEFSMNTHPEDDNFASVALYNGAVEVEFPQIETTVDLKPSEAVILKGENFMKMNEIPSNMRKNNYTEVFELNGSIMALIERISEYYGITVRTNDELEDIECHGRLIFTDNPDELFDMLTYLIPVKYRYINDNTIQMIKSN